MKCLFCNGDLIWENDFQANEVSDMYEDDDDAVVGFYTCSKCGRKYEIYDPPKEEREIRID